MKMLPSSQVFILVGLADAVAMQTGGTDPLGKGIGYALFALALLSAFFTWRRDRRDRKHEQEKQSEQHSANQLALMKNAMLLEEIQKSQRFLMQKEEANRKARHERQNDIAIAVMRFSHIEQWIHHAAACDALPLPPFDALPQLPQRRREDRDP